VTCFGSARTYSAPGRGLFDGLCWPHDGSPWDCYDVFSGSPSPGQDQACNRVGLRFHGKYPSKSSGTTPPASAHAVRYAVSHARGFNPHKLSVCNNENCNAASRPAHTAPLP